MTYPEWALFPKWSEEGNIVPQVYEPRKTSGEACLWTCSWRKKFKLGYEIADLTIPEIWAEIRDYAVRGLTTAAAIAMCVEPDPSAACWSRYLKDAKQVIHDLRPASEDRDFTAPWDMGRATRVIKWRPSWAPPVPTKEFELYLNGVWHWKGIALSAEPYRPPLSRVQARMAADSLVAARVEAVQKSMRRR